MIDAIVARAVLSWDVKDVQRRSVDGVKVKGGHALAIPKRDEVS